MCRYVMEQEGGREGGREVGRAGPRDAKEVEAMVPGNELIWFEKISFFSITYLLGTFY